MRPIEAPFCDAELHTASRLWTGKSLCEAHEAAGLSTVRRGAMGDTAEQCHFGRLLGWHSLESQSHFM